MPDISTYAEIPVFDHTAGDFNFYIPDIVTPIDYRAPINKLIGTIGGADSLVADVVQTQAAGTKIKVRNARFDTVTNPDDASTIVINAIPGMFVNVRNDGANQLRVFPAVGEQINALGVNNDIKIPAGQSKNFFCYTAGWWRA